MPFPEQQPINTYGMDEYSTRFLLPLLLPRVFSCSPSSTFFILILDSFLCPLLVSVWTWDSCTQTQSHLPVPCCSASVSLHVPSHLQGERENREAESKPSLSYPTPRVQAALLKSWPPSSNILCAA